MANDPIPVAPVATPVVPVATPATPVTPTPAAVASPVVESVSPPSTPTPTATPVAAAGTPTPTPTPVPSESTTLVGDGLKPTPAPTETPVEAALDKPEGQSEEPAPPPTYDAFALPEGFNFEGDRIKQFTDILGDFETKNKAEHAAVQEFGQKAVDFHVAELKRTAETIYKEAQETWEKTKTEWHDSFMSDPEIGGNRSQTTLDAALGFIRTYGGNPEQQAEFRSLMDASGVGNHPAMIRLFANAGRATQEHGSPLAATTPISAPKSKVTTMYGGK